MLNEPLLEPSSSQDSSNNVNVGELYTVDASLFVDDDDPTVYSSPTLFELSCEDDGSSNGSFSMLSSILVECYLLSSSTVPHPALQTH